MWRAPGRIWERSIILKLSWFLIQCMHAYMRCCRVSSMPANEILLTFRPVSFASFLPRPPPPPSLSIMRLRSDRQHLLVPPPVVLSDRALCLPTFGHLLIVNKSSSSSSPAFHLQSNTDFPFHLVSPPGTGSSFDSLHPYLIHLHLDRLEVVLAREEGPC